jgi:hypothetical protein
LLSLRLQQDIQDKVEQMAVEEPCGKGQQEEMIILF